MRFMGSNKGVGLLYNTTHSHLQILTPCLKVFVLYAVLPKALGPLRALSKCHKKQAASKCQRTHGPLGLLGWAGLGWAGLGWPGLGWAGLGWAGLGWAGLGWARRHKPTKACQRAAAGGRGSTWSQVLFSLGRRGMETLSTWIMMLPWSKDIDSAMCVSQKQRRCRSRQMKMMNGN